MSEQKFPDIPEPEELPRKGLISSVTYWWIGTFILLGFTIVWLPSQCSTESVTSEGQKEDDINSLPQANQNTDLEFREDGLWYKINQDAPFNGAAMDYHENGEIKSRTKILDGKAIGLIEEWDQNGTLKGVRFKDEFPK